MSASVAILEDDPLFNAGRGAVYNAQGKHELDASIMDGASRRGGARLEALRKNLQHHHGTVGAVALDARGNLAAATSTGGFTGKLPGRIGDSPVVGAGTWADNATCAVSGTGHGELFMRTALAHEVAVDRRGNVAMPFNSEAMLRGCIGRDGRLRVYTA